LAFGVSLAVFIATQIRWYLRPPTFEARQRVKVVVFGSVAALSPGVIIALGSIFTGGETPQNVMAFTAIFYPVAIGYAVLGQDLLEVDRFLRRSLNYAILTAIATLTYVGVAQTVGLFSQRSTQASTGWLGFAFSLVCVVLILLLRDRMQTGIDRLFFRSSYDFRRIVARASARLASVSDLGVIANELSRAVGEALHPTHLKLLVRCGSDAEFQVVHRSGDGVEAVDDAAELERARAAEEPVDDREGGLCVPFRADGRLVAALSLGRSLSGRMYGGEDRGLLQTLANQGAVAIENALRLERLRELNRDLELTVGERTRELRETQAQLVHREKMASLGQFVAGIAHEINNPLDFIQGNMFCLREYVGTMTEAVSQYERIATGADPSLRESLDSLRHKLDLDTVIEDLDSTFEGCAEGIERTNTLVRDLRTFSRLDQPELMPADLHEALDSTLNLLRSKLSGIEVVREFGDIPEVECLAGQMNQVFMNLIANAADALDGSGAITIRSQILEPERVVIEIEDDGCGIEGKDLERIFDPFFSTKAVGQGTGLGLSISYGIVSRHGGTIRARSAVGQGTCFRVELPMHASEVVSEDSPAAFSEARGVE
jgi:signal transduction histidine kinase